MSLWDDFWIQMVILVTISFGVGAIIHMLISPFKLQDETILADGQSDRMTM